MKIDYFSDPHIDMWSQIQQDFDLAIAKKLFPDIESHRPGDVLIIAGDLGHSNGQNKTMLKWFQKNFYKHVIFVMGNHDYYLLWDHDHFCFKTSHLRVKDMRDWADKESNIHCLDGTVIEIDGVRFGGCDSWYDGQYGYIHFKATRHRLQSLWKACMNDSNYVKGVEYWDDLWEIEKPKIEAVYQACDVMVTHVPPSIEKEHIWREFKNDEISAFYTFDGKKYVKEGSMKHWIYGHAHRSSHYRLFKKGFHCNPVGYPGEGSQRAKIKSFEI